MSRRYSSFAHPGVLAPLIVFGVLFVFATFVFLAWVL